MLQVLISSSVPQAGGIYQITGGVASPVAINIFNDASQSVRIKNVYLTCENGAVSLGDPLFKRRGVAFAPANNTVPSASTTTVTGSIPPIPSGSAQTSSWFIAPFRELLTTPLGTQHINIGYYGLDYDAVPNPIPMTFAESTNNSAIINVGATPIFSGAVNQTAALNFTSSLYIPDPEVSQGALFFQLSNYNPPTSSLADEFTYEWWGNIRTYGVPLLVADPTIEAATLWETSGFIGEGAGVNIGYQTDGKLYLLMEEDFTAPLPFSQRHRPYVGLESNAVVPLNQWVHQAVTRNAAGLVTFWINGTGSGTGTRLTGSNPHYCNNGYLFCDNLSIPYLNIDDPSDPFNGLIETTADGAFMQLRMSNFCRYTANFTPPTGAFSPTYDGGGGGSPQPFTGSVTTFGSASYPALFIPQVLSDTYYPDDGYVIEIGAAVQLEGSPTIIEATSSAFFVTGTIIPPWSTN